MSCHRSGIYKPYILSPRQQARGKERKKKKRREGGKAFFCISIKRNAEESSKEDSAGSSSIGWTEEDKSLVPMKKICCCVSNNLARCIKRFLSFLNRRGSGTFVGGQCWNTGTFLTWVCLQWSEKQVWKWPFMCWRQKPIPKTLRLK